MRYDSPLGRSRCPATISIPPPWRRLLDGEHAAVRQQVRDDSFPTVVSATPTLTADISLPSAKLAFRWCRELADEGIGALWLPAEYGGQDDFAAFMAAFETIAFHDISLTIKFTVQFGLWLGSVLLLGREAHHRKYLRDIGSFTLPGCFAMTEIDHGSNVRELETLARFDPAQRTIHRHQPQFRVGQELHRQRASATGARRRSSRNWKPRRKRHGVHAFVVPLRDEQDNVLPGVRIADNGPKMGENGVDNGRVWFDGVRVEREALLDRFGRVEADGSYHSDIRSAGARFFTMISALVGGRISIALAGLSAAQERADHRRALRPAPTAVPRAGRERGNRAARLSDAPAPPAAAARQRLRAGFRAQTPGPTPGRIAGGRPIPAGRAGGRASGRGAEGVDDLEHHAHAANVPRGVRRRGLHQRQPACPRSRTTRTFSPRSRVTTPCSCSGSVANFSRNPIMRATPKPTSPPPTIPRVTANFLLNAPGGP